jgi:hypothetical protein
VVTGITNRLVVTIEAARSDRLASTSAWYPQRSVLVRDLEAARHIAQERASASLLLSDTPVAGGAVEQAAGRAVAIKE